ncbi:NAD-dependent formate dehydrogenase AciA/Fdh [Violaceomyces palustris]|uniref:NAD-dependent formate dehydrogenase AciA/Fdh n=1 Tax=Violaceomyces palustris TaxID=1673888 RepID=A0ACD0P812_9BASI|nr:NAD-dependent formate dehydrogenase AciA/Fdh [Violaceomyces palustris]
MVKVLAILYSGGEFAKQQPRLLGTVENKLGIADWLKEHGHELVVSDDKEGPNSDFQKHIKDAEILITTPFHPGYLSREVMDTAKNLKLCVTAGVGSDHIDLNAANERKITVAEVSGSNVVSVAEHVLMTILNLVRNFVPAHDQITRGEFGGWNVAAAARDTYDLENKVVGTIGAGRIGYRVLQRLVPFDCKELLYYDYAPLPEEVAKKVGARRVEDLKEFLGQCDVVTINCPLHEGTRNLINKETLQYFKKGAWVVNTARGAIVNAQDMADAVKSGHISGYGGDVSFPQPMAKDHPWRTMFNPNGGGNAMTPHVSGTSIDAQIRYANGTKDIIRRYFEGEAQEPQNLIVEGGQYASKAYGQR